MDREETAEYIPNAYEAQTLEGNHSKVVMIPFSGEAKGDYFTGRTLANGVDTQITTAEVTCVENGVIVKIYMCTL